ncbi:glycosyltransferase family 2 protein [Marinomonas posidonica]|uniref:Glycosyl transferase family 2 n=1 Tax=Marinomonas posidonica (strain CECT 7376 / NCIMB 14433 / IVIA-Po-181) TaxID=491952 RepID=F6CS41_MARPP|nr:glycosyltransferase family 2 protein [Marinomonas posidonica]AEF53828.1 glycosyl transferase family 2 [Marinomonas posidonica IVIA-Po-181]
MKKMKVSLIVTTYNWKEALSVTLESVKRQSVLPFEVIVADDGSREDTEILIQELQEKYPVPLLHSWQEDIGFRLAASRNKAIAKSSGDYLIIVDGDLFLPKKFIESHLEAATQGAFVQGGRVLLGEKISFKVLNKKIIPSFFSSDIRNRHNMIDSKILSKLATRIRNNDKSTRGCNFALWKKDALNVNGYNEDFEGWGREDSEMVIRLLNSGLNRIYLKFKAVGYHIYHKENDREMLDKNDEIYKCSIFEKKVFCENGVDQYIK